MTEQTTKPTYAERERRKEEIANLQRLSEAYQNKLSDVMDDKYTPLSNNAEGLLRAEIRKLEAQITEKKLALDKWWRG
jgi:hypothetical protein